jgi:hypothetical protein
MLMRDLRRVLRPLVLLCVSGWSLIVLGACDTATPEQYFSRAVLNSNLLYGFAGAGMHRQLASPPVGVACTTTAPKTCAFCSCAAAEFWPLGHAFSPDISRGWSGHQTLQPVQ